MNVLLLFFLVAGFLITLGPQKMKVLIAALKEGYIKFIDTYKGEAPDNADIFEFLDPVFKYIHEVKKAAKSVLICWIALFSICYWQSTHLFKLLLLPVRQLLDNAPRAAMAAHGLAEPFITDLKVSLISSLILIIPMLIFQFYKFVLTYLNKKSKLFLIKIFAVSLLSFILGVLFAYKIIFNYTFQFFLNYTQSLDLQGVYSISLYTGFVLKLMLFSGVLFQMPALTFFLSFTGIISSKSLRKRRFAIYFTVFFFSFIFTSSVEGLFLTALPILVMYEFTLNLLRFAGPESKVDYRGKTDIYK